MARRARASSGSAMCGAVRNASCSSDVLELEGPQERPEQPRRVLAELQPHTVAGPRHRVEEHGCVGQAQGCGRRRGPTPTCRTRSMPAAGWSRSVARGRVCSRSSSAAKMPCNASMVAPCVATGTAGNAGRSPSNSTANSCARPAARCHRPLVARHIAQWMVTPEPGHLAVHQPRVDRAHSRPTVDPEPVGGGRLERGDHHVRVRPPIRAAPPRPASVVRSMRTLRLPRDHIGNAGGRAQPAAPRRLDHHHVGAVVGQHHARDRGADALADLDDPQALAERAVSASRTSVIRGHARH